MRLRRVALRLYAAPLRRPLMTARGFVARREGLILTLSDDRGNRGYGEASPLPGWSRESLLMVQQALASAAASLEGSQVPETPRAIGERVRALALPPSAAHALDQALLDLSAVASGISLARLLSPSPREAVPVSRLIHGPEDVAAALRSGVRTVKIKVGAAPVEADIARVAAARAAAGPELAIRLDANGGWTEDEASYALARLAPLNPECVEDPVTELEAMARLRRFGVPLAADAPLRTRRDLEQIIALGAADLVVVKPTFVGGLTAGLDLLHAASRAGLGGIVTTVLGAAVERSGALHLSAAAPEVLLPCGLDTGGLLAADVAEGPTARGGVMAVPAGPGAGISLSDPASEGSA